MPSNRQNRISQLIQEERVTNPDTKQSISMYKLSSLWHNMEINEQPKLDRSRKRKSNCLSEYESDSCIYSRFSSYSLSPLSEYRSATHLSYFSYKSSICPPNFTAPSSSQMHKKKRRFQ